MGLITQAQGALHEAAKRGSKVAQLVMHEPSRSPLWPAHERKWKRSHPTCAACGSIVRVAVHHVKPFHLFPQLELDDTNYISLCMSALECHLRVGHLKNWKGFNPNVREDAAIALTAVRAPAVIP